MVHMVDQAVALMVAAFEKYATKDEDKKSLSKSEMKELIQNEMSIGPKLSDKEIKGLMEDLDQNNDDKMSFTEYMTFVGAMATILNEKIQNC